MDSDAIFGWLELLDTLDYYELLNVERVAESDALDQIFKRGTEAYMILSDPGARSEYDRQLVVALPSSPPRMRSVPPPNVGGRSTQAPPKLEDAARTTSAKPFVRRAEELVD